MAEVVPLSGTQTTVKLRHPLGIIGLMLITLGIYFWFWWYYVNREMRDFGESRGTDECGTSPGTSLLAVTLGAFIIVPPFVSIFKGFKRMNASSALAGSGDGFDAGLGLLWRIAVGMLIAAGVAWGIRRLMGGGRLTRRRVGIGCSLRNYCPHSWGALAGNS